jgi:heme exporter protein D
MPDLGKYALEVGLAYGVSALLIAGLVWLSWRRAARIRRELQRYDARER